MREEYLFEPGNDPRHSHHWDHQDSGEYQQCPRPLRRDLNNRQRFGLSVVAQDMSRSLQRGGDSTLHACQINGVFHIVARQVEVFDLRFWPRPVWPGPNGVDEQGNVRVGIQLPTFDVGWRNGKVLPDLFQQQVFRTFLAYLIQRTVITRYEGKLVLDAQSLPMRRDVNE